MKRITLWGVSGFIGRNLSVELVKRGWEVIGCDVAPFPDGLPGEVRCYPADVLDVDMSAIPASPIILYLSQSPFYRDFPDRADHLFGVNGYGPARVLNAVVKQNTQAFLYFSTANVYQPGFEPHSEQDDVNRSNPYAVSKLIGEQVAQLYQSCLRVSTLRLFGTFGPGQRGMLVPKLHNRIIQGQPVILQAHPDAPDEPVEMRSGLMLSTLYIKDLVQILLGLLDRTSCGHSLPGVFNVGSRRAFSIRNLALGIGGVTGKGVHFEPGDAREGDMIADTSLLESIAAIPETPLAEALKETISAVPSDA